MFVLSRFRAKRFVIKGRGYFGGGHDGSNNSNEIDGIQFSDETAINPSATLAVARRGAAGVNSSARGYFGGGRSASSSNEIDGIQFSDETAINPSATLAVARRSVRGINSTERGYFGGGEQGNAYTTRQREIDGIQFSDETAINPSNDLPWGVYGMGEACSSIAGYWGGGYDGTASNKIIKFYFSTETPTTLNVYLTTGRTYPAGVNSSSKGYFGGGSLAHWGTSKFLNEIDGIRFSDETAINPSATLATTKCAAAGVNSSARGYFGGGYNGSNNLNEIDGIQFSDETAINPSATLAVARSHPAGVQSGGYF